MNSKYKLIIEKYNNGDKPSKIHRETGIEKYVIKRIIENRNMLPKAK